MGKIDKFIINYNALPYQTETLQKAGIDMSKIIPSKDHWGFHLQADELVIPSLISLNDNPSLDACLYLRQLYENEIAKAGNIRKIYIQRLNGRTVFNKAELSVFLEKSGFTIIHPEKLTVSKQASLFAGADVIVGPHGAGFTNIVFCKPGTVVIDLFSPHWVNPCYWVIAEHLKLKYGYLEGDHTKQEKTGKATNVSVNLDKLQTLLSRLIND